MKRNKEVKEKEIWWDDKEKRYKISEELRKRLDRGKELYEKKRHLFRQTKQSIWS